MFTPFKFVNVPVESAMRAFTLANMSQRVLSIQNNHVLQHKRSLSDRVKSVQEALVKGADGKSPVKICIGEI